MANSPTLCQDCVAKALAPFRARFESAIYCIHYMGEHLLAAETESLLQEAFQDLILKLQQWNLVITPEKVQKNGAF